MSNELPTAAGVSDPGIRALYRLENRWQAWLDVEAALAKAQEELGIIPKGAAAAIGRAAHLELLDRTRIDEGFARTGHTIVPLVWELSRVTSRSACPSQRQPWAETSWPRRTASCASSGSRSTARPLELTVADVPCSPSTSMIRHQPAREPYSKWLSMAGSGRPASRCSISYTASFSRSPSLIENSDPSSKLTTMDTATRAPPGQC